MDMYKYIFPLAEIVYFVGSSWIRLSCVCVNTVYIMPVSIIHHVILLYVKFLRLW